MHVAQAGPVMDNCTFNQPATNLTMLYDNHAPRYLPHLQHPEVLQMGLAPLGNGLWIETDTQLGDYHQHKLEQRSLLGERVFRGTKDSLAAQRELAKHLMDHLTRDQDKLYRVEGEQLRCLAGDYLTPLNDTLEPLWNCSLWVADDLVIMEQSNGEYRLTAASLCSPSHWRLEDKFDRPLREIHDEIPNFHETLTPRIDRFFEHLKPEHPVVRFNWALQADDQLNPGELEIPPVTHDTKLFYRSERQSLVRLPGTGAIAFTIRVYLHPLELLANKPGALPALLEAIDQTSPALAHYKGFDRLAPALDSLRSSP